MFLLYHSEGCEVYGMVFHGSHINDLRTTICSGMLGHRTIRNLFLVQHIANNLNSKPDEKCTSMVGSICLHQRYNAPVRPAACRSPACVTLDDPIHKSNDRLAETI